MTDNIFAAATPGGHAIVIKGDHLCDWVFLVRTIEQGFASGIFVHRDSRNTRNKNRKQMASEGFRLKLCLCAALMK